MVLDPEELVERYLIVGLGNPGRQYAGNRHNVGFQSVDYIARLYDIPLNRRRFRATFGEGAIIGKRVVLAQPQTFMNESGHAVAPLVRWFRVPLDHLIVIYDDLDLELGQVRIRPEGSSGGHNGLKSIIAMLKSQAFGRVRIGIGRPTVGDPADYVLNDFGRDQEPVIVAAYQRVDEVLRALLEKDVHEAMNLYNGQPLFPL
jgi:PTH1 family peptidyl-tRNA hydrolase